MSDLLPVLFSRGQSEGIDPRIAPPNVHVVAQNVRWRKDGRPAKRYGLAQISATGLDSGGSVYTQHNVNFVSSWRGAPLLGLGAGVRRLLGSTWSDVTESNQHQLPHFAPGRHDPIARSDQATLANSTVAYANGYLLYAWDDGTSVYCQVVSSAGAVLFAAKLVTNLGIYPRAVAVGSMIYLLYVDTGGALHITCQAFDTTSLSFVSSSTVGTLGGANMRFDATTRGSDWLLVYQSGATAITAKLMSGASTPGVVQTQALATAAAPGNCLMAIVGTSSSVVFVAWLEPTPGNVKFQPFNNGFTASLAGVTTVETDVNNIDQPGVTFDSINTGGLFWGGYNGNAYLRYADIANTGSAGIVHTVWHLRPCSRPFYGNADAAALDGRFIWCHTHDTGNPGWDDQRTFYLMWFNTLNSAPVAQLWTPNMVGSVASSAHMCDVVSDGSGSSNTTFWTALNQVVREGGGTSDAIGVDSVSFTSIFARQREAARGVQQAGRAAQISGGILYEFNGSLEESGFMHAPVIQSASATAGGALTAGTYLYRAVYEWLDPQGRRHRSAPSDPASVTVAAGNLTATLTIATLAGYSRRAQPTLHVYRTLVGGTSYHRVTPNTGAPTGYGAARIVTYADAVADTTIASTEFLYTDGGVVPNAYPPPCTFLTECNGRIWLGGQLDRNVLTASKILVDGEPTQFSDEAEFSVFLPEDCTGIASIDGTVVAFAREAIYLVNGDGPDDQGTGSFSPPQKLPTDVGCIDWRSVVATSLGVLFQSKRGIYLLPRGFNAPVFVGFDVMDTMVSFPVCMSATLVSVPASSGKLGEITVRFMMGNAENSTFAVCLVYDLRVGGWSVDISPNNSPQLGPAGTWNDAFVQTKSLSGHFDSIWQESNATFDDAGSFITTELGTGDIRPFGVAGYGGFGRVVVLGEYRGAAFVNVTVSVDGAAPDFFSFNVTGVDAGVADGSVYLDVTPKTRLGSSIRVTVLDTAGTPSEGFIAQALFIESETIGKTKRLAAARKA